MTEPLHAPCVTSIQHGADGWCEIAVRSAGELVAVITHPCAGAKWFIHRAITARRESFRSRKAALASLGVVS